MNVAAKVGPEIETPKPQKIWFAAAVALLILIFSIELIVPARRQSSSFDEGIHTFAGYSYWARGDFGLNPEHPPLVKLLAALPLLRDQVAYPNLPPIFFKFACSVGARQFLYADHNADSMLFRARMAAATLTIATVLVVFAAAYEMFGATVGLLALVLFVFEPNLIAHGSFVTTDMGASLFLFAAVYAFYRYVKKPSVLRLVLTGLMAGLALAAKHSGMLWVPILFLLALVEIARADKSLQLCQGGRFKCLLRLARTFVVVGLISLGILWSFYHFRYAAKPRGEAMVPPLSEYAADIPHPWEKSLILTCAHYRLLPESYLYGLTDIVVFPQKYMRSYLFGKQNRHAQWFYFPAVFVIKSTLGFLLLLLLLPVAIALRRTERSREILFLLLPVAVYFLAATRSGFNIGVRHILPVYPFLIVLAAFAAWSVAQHGRLWRYAVALLLVFHCVSSARAFPNPLAYSNEIWGGPANTYKYLTDSNVDWAQQLKSTKKFLDERGIKDCWFDYVGRGIVVDPGYYGISCRPLQERIGRPVGEIPPHISGTVLISATELSGTLWGPGELNPYAQFQRLQPDAIIDDGILVFHGEFDVPLAAAMAHAGAAQGMLMNSKPDDAQLKRALVEAQTAVSLAPTDVGSQMMLGDALMKFNRKDEAQAAYQTALSLAQSVYPEFQDGWVEDLKKRLQ
jgi:4-amino-4-deoxy-L-arabinose transferase-like glycosyltransferase